MKEVFDFAKEVYGEKRRKNFNETYLEHIISVASILQEMKLDQTTIAAGVLHDVIDTVDSLSEKEVVFEKIRKKFGKDITEICKRNSELQRIYYSFHQVRKESVLSPEKAENLRKMFLAIAKDLRVVLIDLASRVDGLEKIKQLPSDLQKIYATETIHIFVPIANRLGLGEIKTKLEDLAFEYLDPKTFQWLKENIKEKYEERQRYLEKFIPHFKKILKKEKIKYSEISYRTKSYWSAYQKLQRHNMDFEKVYDLVALRLIVKDVAACYKALGIIHKYFRPMSGQIQDYIAKPKENGYKSIHTTVFISEERISEIQIKTEEMHKEAMFGVCAHWAYKERVDLTKDPEKLKFSQNIPEFLKTFKIDFFEDQIFAFTPKGDIIALPKGSIPIDFAYAVHSDIGNHCQSAKIDGKIIPLSQPLKSGDVVEIITDKKRLPSLDWLKFVKTSFAKSHIRKILAVTFIPILAVPTFIGKKIAGIVKKPKKEGFIERPKTSEVYIGDQKGIAVTFAKCCLPRFGDVSKAYIGKTRSAVLHKVSCKNFQKIAQKFPEKIIDASWHQS